VTGQRPALTRRIAIEPAKRWPACMEAPTTTPSALTSSATWTSWLYVSPVSTRKV
jgi:hypothetical protein